MIQIQANMAGFAGRPQTVLGALDEETGILVIAAVVDVIPRRDGCVLIETDSRADRDSLFSYEDLKSAISAYYELKGSVAADGKSACLRFTERAMRADPSGGIELDGIDVSGPIYRISPEAGNAQIGALALCRYARNFSTISDTLGMADELGRLLSGQAVTI